MLHAIHADKKSQPIVQDDFTRLPCWIVVAAADQCQDMGYTLMREEEYRYVQKKRKPTLHYLKNEDQILDLAFVASLGPLWGLAGSIWKHQCAQTSRYPEPCLGILLFVRVWVSKWCPTSYNHFILLSRIPAGSWWVQPGGPPGGRRANRKHYLFPSVGQGRTSGPPHDPLQIRCSAETILSSISTWHLELTVLVRGLIILVRQY